MLELIADYFDGLLSLFYPDVCPCCNRNLNADEQYICFVCNAELPLTGYEELESNPVEKSFYGRVNIERAAAYLYFRKEGIVQQLIHHIKYRGGKDYAWYIGEKFGQRLKTIDHWKCDVIVPVPMHRKKLRNRGFNQAEWIAKGLADALDVPLNTTDLVKTVKTSSQTRKSRINRWKNVSDIFQISDKSVFVNKTVLLVDDVITTGATLEACAQTLLDLNCGVKIKIATIAFAT